MEFNQKLQELRKQRGLTQEELGGILFVSRTAISKWESGRGYPNIDSLKAIAKYFGITVDELLSSEEILAVAEQDNKERQNGVKDLIFGLIDISFLLLMFLPFFAQKIDGIIYEVTLIELSSIKLYLKVSYFVVTLLSVAIGLLTLIFQYNQGLVWLNIKRKASIVFNMCGLVLFIISLQPYASILSLVFLIIKTLTLKKE